MSTTSRAIAALALTTSLLLSPLPQAHAEETITHQSYADLVRIPYLRSLGLTGKGITIAYIEGAPDLTVPELQGANIEIKNPCNHTSAPSPKAHSTAVVGILANKDWGWTPDAHIINYTVTIKEDSPEECADVRNLNKLIHKALDDGADVINLSLGSSNPGTNQSGVLRAAFLGIPIVVAAGNSGEDEKAPSIYDADATLAHLNTVIGVGSLTPERERSKFSSIGNFITIMAPGEDFKIRDFDDNGNLSVIKTVYGTSISAPMITGLLALGKQKWPNATGHQLTRSLIDTATPVGDKPNPYYGYGVPKIDTFLNTDPTTYENTSPLFTRENIFVTPQKLTDYQDGLLETHETADDPTYHYRGINIDTVSTHPDTAYFGTSPRYHR